jgi:hypothetical protein
MFESIPLGASGRPLRFEQQIIRAFLATTVRVACLAVHPAPFVITTCVTLNRLAGLLARRLRLLHHRLPHQIRDTIHLAGASF